MTAIISFGVSVVLMALLIALKRFELRSGKRYLARMRNGLDRFVIRLWNVVVRRLPRLLFQSLRYVIIHITDLLSSGLLRIIRIFEHRLNRFVHAVKGKKQLNGNGSSSNHLKDMAEHKQEVREHFQQENQ